MAARDPSRHQMSTDTRGRSCRRVHDAGGGSGFGRWPGTAGPFGRVQMVSVQIRACALTLTGPLQPRSAPLLSPLPPSGWYADPERPRTWRYWDGRQWTTHRAPMATSSSAPLRAKRPVWSPAGVLLTLGAIVGTGILGTVAVGLAAGSGAVSTNPPSTRVAAAPGPTTSVAVTPVAPPTSAAIPTPPRPTSIPVKPAPATTPKMTGGRVGSTGRCRGNRRWGHHQGPPARHHGTGTSHRH